MFAFLSDDSEFPIVAYSMTEKLARQFNIR